MSFDLKLPHTCDHRVLFELTVVGSDRKSIRTIHPLVSSQFIDVFISGTLIPKERYLVSGVRGTAMREVQLKEALRRVDDFVEISYQTSLDNCPKCVGLKVIDDVQYNIQGRWRRERDEDLLLQNLEKWTVTELGSNIFHSFVGSSLVPLLGGKISDPSYLETKITGEVNAALSKFSELQSQYEGTGRPVTDGEILEKIVNIDVRVDERDPTIFLVDVTVRARSGKGIEFRQLLRRAA